MQHSFCSQLLMLAFSLAGEAGLTHASTVNRTLSSPEFWSRRTPPPLEGPGSIAASRAVHSYADGAGLEATSRISGRCLGRFGPQASAKIWQLAATTKLGTSAQSLIRDHDNMFARD